MRGTRKGAKKARKKGRNGAIIVAMKMLCVVDAGDGIRATFSQQRLSRRTI
nr:hypothetical protein [uncultured Campylobacter sp.]